MTGWQIAACGLLPPLLAAVVATGHGPVARRLVATSLATSLSIILLAVLSFAFDQPSSIDLALTLAILTLPGTLVFALFAERWL